MIKFATVSETGTVRPKNDDRVNVVQKDDMVLALLCDGMGGYSFGDYAASEVITTFSLEFINRYKPSSSINTKRWIGETIEKAKLNLKNAANADSIKRDMGTTVVGVLVVPSLKTIFVFNCGDSRAYVQTVQNLLVLVTKDHSYANYLIDNGMDELEAHRMPNGRALTSSICVSGNTKVEIYEFSNNSYKNSVKILLTSDGVHEFVDQTVLQNILLKYKDPKKIVSEIVKQATFGSSNDNMSAVVLTLEGNHVN
ncbi:PP2C family protein-serine/threonine phosphatase [Mycoplasma corogypsi]|uniref:PP2C family protein-serine/threonine phosphatase n=1 Tax=Mycoplasma corogypsi TaxID=2106 RepID=UPI003873BD71